MNNLEEISINEEALGSRKVTEFNSKLNNLIPKLKNLNKVSANISGKFTQNMDSQHKSIADEIYNRSNQEVKVNQKFLYDVIENEKLLSMNLEDLISGKGEIITLTQVEQKKNELIKLQTFIIQELEKINFVEICKIKKQKDNKLHFKSLNKIWVWCLELFFNLAASYYDWDDFKKKAFKKDKGAELKRRMIIYNYKTLKFGEFNDLSEICNVHASVISEKFANNEDLMKFLEVLKVILKFKEQSDIYEEMKENVVEESDVTKVKDEKIQEIKNKIQLCSIKYDVLSEMNNFLNMITREFTA